MELHILFPTVFKLFHLIFFYGWKDLAFSTRNIPPPLFYREHPSLHGIANEVAIFHDKKKKIRKRKKKCPSLRLDHSWSSVVKTRIDTSGRKRVLLCGPPFFTSEIRH
ncbi:hypothetical protein AVEN_104141-1 [Araneus ventricosus]|uniref:Uncharacterized protein n=1 Tax=Araneus ventricosus TaxID=182803 RepID=A0A4Y2I8E9_ARAVE|nr:hypothetical protein AVEN_104141-1 [Araneus ventricosus]